MHRIVFEDFIKHARTDIYHLMCSIIAHDKQQPSYEYKESSILDRPITNNEKIEELEALGSTFNFIDCWLKLFHHNY